MSSSNINVRISNLPDVLRAFQQAPEKMVRNVERQLSRGAMEVTREAKINAPKAFSTLANSINSIKTGEMTYKVSAGVNYAYEVEFGRKNGTFPKVQHILEWMRVKGITSLGESLSQRDVAYFIARKIYKNGIAPQPFLSTALASKRSRLSELVHQGIDDGIREVFQ